MPNWPRSNRNGPINAPSTSFTGLVNPNWAADDAYFANPVGGAGLPNTSQQINRPQSMSYYFQENVSFWKDRIVLVGGKRWFLPGGTDKNNITGVVTDRPDKSFDTYKWGAVFRPIPAVSVYYTDSQNIFLQTGRTDRFQGFVVDPEGLLDLSGRISLTAISPVQ